MLTPAAFGAASWPAAGIIKTAASRNMEAILAFMEHTVSEMEVKGAYTAHAAFPLDIVIQADRSIGHRPNL